VGVEQRKTNQKEEGKKWWLHRINKPRKNEQRINGTIERGGEDVKRSEEKESLLFLCWEHIGREVVQRKNGPLKEQLGSSRQDDLWGAGVMRKWRREGKRRGKWIDKLVWLENE